MDEPLVELVRSRVRETLPVMRDFRRAMHAAPEVGLETPGTARRIREALARTSFVLRKPLMEFDVVADLGEQERRICLRADIDALPISEVTVHDYKSAIPGRMHACGHDGHTAMLVGAALVLDSLREHLKVGVRLAFQPGEEVICAGKAFVNRGACDGCESAYATHGWPGLPAGCVSSRQGPLFAAGSHFTITLTGKGCHGALPERGNNPIPPAARIVSELQGMHLAANTEDGSVVSVCSLQAGDSSNVIPDAATILGTTRYLDPQIGGQLESTIRLTVAKIAAESAVQEQVDFDSAYELPVSNTAAGYSLVKELAEQYAKWRETDKAFMTMDDFAFYLRGREGAMFLLGLGEDWPALHSQGFDFNDEVLETGALMHCLIALAS